MTKIAIIGAGGRMGRRLITLASEHGCALVAAIVREGSPLIGRDAGELAGIGKIDVPITSALRGQPQVLIDFSTPRAARHWLEVAQQRGIAALIGTTGLAADDHAAIDAAARRIAVLQAPNLSMGVAVLLELARRAAEMLGACDIEIVEAHHRAKKDTPSGTALALASAIGDAAGSEDVPTHSLRIGDEVGRHTAYFAMQAERVELTHVATNRDAFACGALRAATWLAQQNPGRYAIADLLKVRGG